MAPYQIRRYQDQDWHVVRAIFAEGMLQQVVSNFWHLLKQPRIFLLILGLTSALFLGSGSLLSLLALPGFLAVLWLVARYPFSYYVEHTLRTDMWDIRASYLSARGSCFWVAESGGQVVGLVCARPARDASEGQKHTELLHLSVRWEYRGQGIAKALTQTVFHFAWDQGCVGIVLVTSSLNYKARRLYESLGFWKTHETLASLKWAFLAISLSHYKYALSLSS